MSTGKRIQAARKKAGYTQKQLAEMCGVATGTIQQYELDKRQPRLEQLQKIAIALKVDVKELLEWKYIPEFVDEVYASDLSTIALNLSNNYYNFSADIIKKLKKKIDHYILEGNQIKDLDEREEYFFNKEASLSHEMLNYLMEPYQQADIMDIVDIVNIYLSLTDGKQGMIIELLNDLYENKYLRKAYWERKKDNSKEEHIFPTE